MRKRTAPPASHAARAAEAGPRMRDAQKAATRAKIVAAARDLFTERGYHSATVRDITARAGVSTGSLFTSFTGKAGLLQEIVQARLEGLLNHARGALGRGESAEGILISMGRLAYAYEAKELRLLAESIGASWTWDREIEEANRRSLAGLLEMIASVLEMGKARGELAADADVVVLTHTIFSCYLQNFRLAIYDDWPPDRMADLLGQQIRLVLQGASQR
jgi:AcrR family transcriptional regulator